VLVVIHEYLDFLKGESGGLNIDTKKIGNSMRILIDWQSVNQEELKVLWGDK
jgi:hypothetical protein